jgi:hypothetical protein
MYDVDIFFNRSIRHFLPLLSHRIILPPAAGNLLKIASRTSRKLFFNLRRLALCISPRVQEISIKMARILQAPTH